MTAPAAPVVVRARARWGPRVVAGLVAATLLLAGCRAQGEASPTPTPTPDPAVRVAAGPQPESRLLAEVLAALLRAEQIDAEVVLLADAEDARQALEGGDVEVLASYTGAAWLQVLGRADPPSDQATSLARVRERDELEGLVWLGPPISTTRSLTSPPADATFAFVVDADGPHRDVVTLSQLAARLGQLAAPALCVDPTFVAREDGLPVVLDAYSIAPDIVQRPVAPADAVLGVAAGDCDAGLTNATAGDAWAAGQRPLLDDLGVFPAFVVVPVVAEELLEARPEVRTALQPLVEQLTTAMLGQWNAEVVTGSPLEQVADRAAVQLRGGTDEPTG